MILREHLPPSWKLQRLRHVVTINPETLPESTEPDYEFDYLDISALEGEGSTDFVPQTLAFAAAPSRARRVLRTGDVVVSTVRTYLRAVAAVGELPRPTVASTGFAVLRPNGVLAARFAYWAVLAEPFIGNVVAHSEGVSYPAIAPSVLGLLPVPVPPDDVQREIAQFLDRETARIDALIEKKTRFIELLREKRQALIAQAVTRGLDPTVPTKESDAQWLGQVPAHWRVTRLCFAVESFEQGWSPECFAFPASAGEWGVLKAGCVNRGVFDEDQNKRLPEEHAPRAELEVHQGDVLMSRASGSVDLIGSVARATATAARLMLSDKIFRLRLRPDWDADFFVLAMNSTALREQIKLAISGAEGLANNLAQASIKEFSVVQPPLVEQVALVKETKIRTVRLDNLVSKTEASVLLLRERRAALITAAVTGQIDVREAAVAPAEPQPA